MLTVMSVRGRSLKLHVYFAGALALLFFALAPAMPAHAGPNEPQAPAPWVIECIDCPHRFSDLTPQAAQIDSQGVIHIVYGGEQLYHAWQGQGGWQVEVADPTVNVGRLAALAIDATNRLHAVYLDDNAHTLRYAVGTTGAWHSELVDPNTILEANTYPSIAVDQNGRPHVAYYRPGGGGLHYLVRGDTGWQTEVVDDQGDVGKYASLAVDSAGNPHIAYFDVTLNALRYAVKQSGVWTRTTVYGQAANGAGAALVLGTGDSEQIAAALAGKVVYYTLNGANWNGEDVPNACALEPGVETGSLGLCGRNLALRLNAAGEPRLAWFNHYDWLRDPYSGPRDYLRYAARMNGQWNVMPLGIEGTDSQLVLDAGGNPHVPAANKMELADHVLNGTTWQNALIERGGRPGAISSLAIDPYNRPQVSGYDTARSEYFYGLRQGSAWAFSGQAAVTTDGRSVLAVAPDGRAHVLFLNTPRGPIFVRSMIANLGGWTDDPALYNLFNCDLFDKAIDREGATHVACRAYNGLFYYKSGVSSGSTIEGSDQQDAVSIAVDAKLVPHVAYVNVTNRSLHYATLSKGHWVITTVATNIASGTDGKWSTSIAVRPDGQPEIAYMNKSTGNSGADVLLAVHGSKGWAVALGGWVSAMGLQQLDLAVDSAGKSHVAFYDSINQDLLYSLVKPGRNPEVQAVDSAGNVGQNPSIALDILGQPHISYYDATNATLKQAYIALPTPLSIYLPEVRRDK